MRPSVCLGEAVYVWGEAVCMSGVRPSVWGRPSVCLGEAVCMSGGGCLWEAVYVWGEASMSG